MTEERELKLLHLSWDDIQSLAEKVAECVKESNFRPDLIVAVSRGGFDPARILCDQLAVRRLASVQIEYYTGMNQTTHTPKVVFPLNADVSGLNVLVVDDVSDTGNSLRAVREHVFKQDILETKVATLHIKPWTTFKPDYYAREVDAWIVYPWEPLETMTFMVERLEAEDLTPMEVRHRLVEMGFNPELVGRLTTAQLKTWRSSL